MKAFSWKIGAHMIDVEMVPPRDMDRDAVATYSQEHNCIRIQEDLPLSQTVTAILHEVLHQQNNEMEEEKIEYIAQSMGQFLLDNDLLNKDFINKIINDSMDIKV